MLTTRREVEKEEACVKGEVYRAVTDAVIGGFEDIFPTGNARKLQPLNNRTVRYRRQR